jgi:hypothetical protein
MQAADSYCRSGFNSPEASGANADWSGDLDELNSRSTGTDKTLAAWDAAASDEMNMPSSDTTLVPAEAEARHAAYAYAETMCDRVVDQLAEMFAEHNGRQPFQEEKKLWVETLKQAVWEQQKARRAGIEAVSTVHIAGVLVDINSGEVAMAKRVRPIGLRIDREGYPRCFQEGCPKRGSFQHPARSGRAIGACKEHAPEGFVPEKLARGRSEGAGRQRVSKACDAKKSLHYVSRQCAWEGCTKTPSFSEPNAKKCVICFRIVYSFRVSLACFCFTLQYSVSLCARTFTDSSVGFFRVSPRHTAAACFIRISMQNGMFTVFRNRACASVFVCAQLFLGHWQMYMHTVPDMHPLPQFKQTRAL